MRQYKLQPDKHDERDNLFARMPLAYSLPSSIDLRPNLWPCFDQGSLGSCTANAGAFALEFTEVKKGKPLSLLSRLYIYFKEREMEGTINEDAGAQIRDLMKVLLKNGSCLESSWTYDISKFTVQPPAECDIEAANHRITSYQRLLSQDAIKRSLYEGFPVVFGMKIFERFESEEVARTGKVPMPKRDEQCLGGHAVVFVGYVDTGKTFFGRKKGYFICRNSWSPEWGDNGYFYLDYDFVSKYCFDFWTVR